MNTIALNTTTLRNNLSTTLDEISGKESVALVTKRGRPITALISIDLLEDLLALTNKKYLSDIKAAREEYEKGNFSTHDQIFGEL